ncbi:EAL domain-containing protein [Actinoplanes sp. NEAU-A12]|uniref:EAL domain-containing protein n=1 Tax=Actinoplanes sandaracinus TaxID=3045177 RepID=A0ABT6WX87_9ACTN|nr:EAL domain-containing protein [Actinoplanes sandaracinus]MDI6104348.1 EAL domain-containing protein [Actinoplanes sandaracinus]
MGTLHTEEAQQVAALLRTAREALGLSLAFMTRMDDTHLHLEVLDSAVPLPVPGDAKLPRRETLCQKIMDGELPAVIPDVRVLPSTMRAFEAPVPQIRSFLSVPVVLSDGSVYGTFCAVGFAEDSEPILRDKAIMEVLSRAAALVVEPGVRKRAVAMEILDRVRPLIARGGPVVLLQPIVDLTTWRRVGAEALSRFPQEWNRTPDVCFADAHGAGEGHRLEIQALRRAADHLADVTGYVSMNVSPATLLTAECSRMLEMMPLHRVVLELSEHDPVEDYDALMAVLAPLRAGGMRFAIDDVGAGFSSLRHIVITAPDVIKLDRSMVTGLDRDPVLQVVARSLVDLARTTGAQVVAEGVETEAEAAALLDVGVGLGQGWLFDRATTVHELRDSYHAAAYSTAA